MRDVWAEVYVNLIHQSIWDDDDDDDDDDAAAAAADDDDDDLYIYDIWW